MHKIIIFLVIFLLSKNAFADFVHPLIFDEKTQKEEVLNYIKDRVKQDYCSGSIDMCNHSTLRMMEQQNLDSFKKLTQAQDKKIMDKVIEDYCSATLDMCSYSTILMMYEQNLKASKKELEW